MVRIRKYPEYPKYAENKKWVHKHLTMHSAGYSICHIIHLQA